MAFTEKYVSSSASGSGNGNAAGTPYTWDQMITEIKSATGTGGQGKRYNVKADGTYARTGFDDIGGGGTGTNVLPVVIRGYKTTIGDGYLGRTTDNGALITTNMPLVTYTTNQAFNLGRISAVESIQFSGDRDWAVLSIDTRSSAFGCVVTNSGANNAIAVQCQEASVLWECDLTCSTATGPTRQVVLCDGDGPKVISCRIFSNSNNATTTGVKINKFGLLLGNLIRGNGTGIGISQEGDNWGINVINNTIAKWGDAIYMTVASNGNASVLWGNMVTDCSGYGLNGVAGNMFFIGPNRMRGNTSGNISTAANTDWANVARFWPLVTTGAGAASDYVNAGSNDYNLISTSAARQANVPKYLDLGAYDMKDPSGGGATAVLHPLIPQIIRPAPNDG